MVSIPLRWGILSAGKISHDFCVGLGTLPKTDHVIQAVAAREKIRAQDFANVHGILTVHDDYTGLAKDPNVDVVYIGCLNPQHYEMAKLMLENKKPVLCEKPLTLNLKQTKKLVEIARKNKIFLMEAVWSRSFPAYKELEKQLKAGTIGEVLQVIVNLGADLAHVDRLSQKDLGGSAILDLGVYTLQLTQFVYRGLKPIKVLSGGHLNHDKVDSSVNAILVYPDNKMASLQISGLVLLPNEAIIVGSKGTIKIPNFWCPTSLILPTTTIEFPLPKGKHEINFKNSEGLRYEAEEVRVCLQKGLIENPSITLDETLELAELMDTLRHQVGTKFREDN